MQTQPLPRRPRSSKRQRPPGPYSTLPRAIKTILNTEGLLAFYRGLAPDTLSTLLSNLLFYYFYSLFSRLALRRKRLQAKAAGGGSTTGGKGSAPPPLGALQELFIGCAAGMVSKAGTMPLGNVTIRQQTAANEKEEGATGKAKENGGPNGTPAKDGRRDSVSSESSDDSDLDYATSPSLLSTIRLLIKERGPLGLWAGFPSTCILTLSPSITLYLFEALKRLTLPKASRNNPSAGATFITSATASAIANAILYPLILSKVLAQYRGSGGSVNAAGTPGLSNKKAANMHRYQGTFGPLRMAWDRQGWRGITLGLEAQLLKNFIGRTFYSLSSILWISALIATMIAQRGRR